MAGEFEFIDDIKSRFALARVGDDCAVLPQNSETDIVVTADMLVENVDFRLAWSTPAQIGHKALAVSLSDIAAMGAEPRWAMLSLGFPQDLWKSDFADRFYEGWHALAGKFGVELVGGDISRAEQVVIDSIVFGEVPKGKAILRSGARPGDRIYVSGTLGGAGGGLKLLLKNEDGVDEGIALIEKQLQPTPQILLGKQLQQSGLSTSLIDLSDGLSSDLAHLCKASGVGARIDPSALPVHPDLARSFPPDVCLDLALNAGEDFELLLTAREDLSIEGLTRIGEVTDGARIELATDDGVSVLPPRGFRHF